MTDQATFGRLCLDLANEAGWNTSDLSVGSALHLFSKSDRPDEPDLPITIELCDGSPAVSLTANLGAVPRDQRGQVYADLLAASLFPTDLDLAYALETVTEKVVLRAVVPLVDLAVKPLSGFLVRLVTIARDRQRSFSEELPTSYPSSVPEASIAENHLGALFRLAPSGVA